METNLKFNSAICTSRQQSERLLALGLKKGTADMCINLSHESELVYSFSYSEALSLYHNYGLDRITNTDLLLPAWSLHRLIEMMPNNIRVYDSIASLIVSNEKVQYYFHDVEYSDYLTSVGRWKSGDIYDNIIDCIEWLIKEGYFNKEYLE